MILFTMKETREYSDEQGYKSRDLQRVRMKTQDDVRRSFSSLGEIPSFDEGEARTLSSESNSKRDISVGVLSRNTQRGVNESASFEVRIDRGTYIQIVGGVGILTQEERTKFDVKQRKTLIRTTLEVVIVGKSPDVYS